MALLVSFLVALGVATWIFTKLQQRTGYGNSTNAYIGGGVVFIIVFIILFTISHTVLSH